MQLVEMLVSKLFNCILSNFYCICVRRSVGVAEVAAQHFIAATLEEISSLTAAGDNTTSCSHSEISATAFSKRWNYMRLPDLYQRRAPDNQLFNITMLKQRVFLALKPARMLGSLTTLDNTSLILMAYGRLAAAFSCALLRRAAATIFIAFVILPMLPTLSCGDESRVQ